MNDTVFLKNPTPAITDNGTGRMGMLSPAFPVLTNPPEKTADDGKVRLGMLSPSFPK